MSTVLQCAAVVSTARTFARLCYLSVSRVKIVYPQPRISEQGFHNNSGREIAYPQLPLEASSLSEAPGLLSVIMSSSPSQSASSSTPSTQTSNEDCPRVLPNLNPSRRIYKPGPWDDEENIEDYRSGGFHPVHLGDTYGDSERYRIIHKLGHGGFATVWLARAHGQDGYVALKIMMAEVSVEDSRELKLLASLKAAVSTASGEQHPGRDHIAWPLHHFWIDGPNGRHLCLVMPVGGPRVSELWLHHELPVDLPRKMALQVSLGLQFLHSNGVGHGGTLTPRFL